MCNVVPQVARLMLAAHCQRHFMCGLGFVVECLLVSSHWLMNASSRSYIFKYASQKTKKTILLTRCVPLALDTFDHHNTQSTQSSCAKHNFASLMSCMSWY